MAEQGDFKISISGKSAEKIAGTQIFPQRDPQENITGFENEFQQGFTPTTPTALSPEQRTTQEPGFQQGFNQQQPDDDFGRPDLSKVIKASTTLSQQIKEAENTLSKISSKSIGALSKIAKTRKLKLSDVQKIVSSETARLKGIVADLKEKKSGLEELSFGKKPTAAEDLAERKFLADQPKRKIVESVGPGGTPTFKDEPAEEGISAKEKAQTKKLEAETKKILKSIGETKITIKNVTDFIESDFSLQSDLSLAKTQEERDAVIQKAVNAVKGIGAGISGNALSSEGQKFLDKLKK